jgi:hypothetical protein
MPKTASAAVNTAGGGLPGPVAFGFEQASTPACTTNGDCRDDAFSCTIAVCDANRCVQASDDSRCDDHAECTRNMCDPEHTKDATGCVFQEIANFCDDGWFCTDDACVPGASGANADSGCLSQPDDEKCQDDTVCDGAEACSIFDVAADANGCVEGEPPACDGTCETGACDDADGCLIDVGDDCNDGEGICKENGQCSACNPTVNPQVCDQGYCIVGEICATNGDCVPGSPRPVDDDVACTIDSCDETTDSVVHVPSHVLCDDSNPCTSDFCHATDGCLPGINLPNGSVCKVGLEVGVCQGGTCVDRCQPVLADVPNIPQVALEAVEASCPTCPAAVETQYTHWSYRMCVRAASMALRRSKILTATQVRALRKAARDSDYARN